MQKKYYIGAIFFVFTLYMIMLPSQFLDHFGFLYVSVAWEMYAHHHWILPLLDLQPYNQKPPFVFWLMMTAWHIFGVSEPIARTSLALFTPLTAILTARFAQKLFPSLKAIGLISAFMLFTGTAVGIYKMPYIRLDSVLMFFVLAAVYSLYQYFQTRNKLSLLWLALSIGLALLTKGPVAFVFILPAYVVGLVVILFYQKDRIVVSTVVGLPLLAMILGIVVALLWFIPACIKGGESYTYSLLWGASVGRVAQSSHDRLNFFFYWPYLAALFLPWPLFSLLNISVSNSCRYWRKLMILMATILVAVLIMSFIKAKGGRYILPISPFVAIVWAYFLASGGYTKRLKVAIIIFFVMVASLAVTAIFLQRGTYFHHFTISPASLIIFAILAYAVALFMSLAKFKSLSSFMLLAFVAYGLCTSIIMSAYFRSYSKRHNYFQVADQVKTLSKQGYHLVLSLCAGSANSPRYFEFMLRRDQPIRQLPYAQAQIWLKNGSKRCLLVQNGHYDIHLSCHPAISQSDTPASVKDACQ